MNREKALELIGVWNKDEVIGKVNNKILMFARQHESDIDEIESMSDNDLISEWKVLVFINYIYGQVSMNEMERIALMELEFQDRISINKDELTKWYDKAKEDYDKQEMQE